MLLDPGAAAGESWWQANVLSQLPEGIYASAAQAEAAAQLIEETNRMRTSHGLAAVQPLTALNRAAQAHAVDQATRDYWSHHTPEGLSSRQRVHAAGGGDVTAGGENSSIGVFGAMTPAGIVSGWSTHPGHRELLFNSSVRFAGAGIYCYKDSEYEYFVLLLVDE